MRGILIPGLRREGFSVLCLCGKSSSIFCLRVKSFFILSLRGKGLSDFRLRGKGIPYLRGSGRGDQFVSVKLNVPKNLSSHQKEALREFAAAMGEETPKSRGIFGKKKR